jgi:uncharacterized membrane protein YfcA
MVLGARMVYAYWEKGKNEEKSPQSLSTTTYLLIIIFSLVVGIISGLLGIGGGILIVPFMTYVLKYPTKFAAGSSHLIISFSALAGIIGHATSHRIDWFLIAATGIAVLIGGNLGARFSLRVSPKMIKVGLGLLMWALSVQILVKLLGIT